MLRKLTRSEYVQSVKSLLGDGLAMPELPPDGRLEHFRSTATLRAAMTPGDVELYAAAAYRLAAAALAQPRQREALLGCKPGAADDVACARAFFPGFLRRAWRRPVTAEEIERFVRGASLSAARFGDATMGLEEAIATVLLSPSFLHRVEETAAPTEGTVRRPFDGFTMASRLSFLFRGTSPDSDLLDAAQRGDLSTASGVRTTAERLAREAGAKATLSKFLSEVLDFDDVALVDKDDEAFPKLPATFGATLAQAAARFVDDVALGAGGGLKALLLSDQVFADASLASIYGASGVSGSALRKLALPEGSRRVGYLGSAPFLALYAGPTASSPTHRGLAVRRAFLCDEIPNPPAGIAPQVPSPPPGAVWTTRETSEQVIKTSPCGTCHAQMDQVGFAFEEYDAIGKQRSQDQGKPIDPVTTLDGATVSSPRAVAEALLATPRLATCMARQLFRYATGMRDTLAEAPALEAMAREARGVNLTFDVLLAALGSSDLFRHPAGARE